MYSESMCTYTVLMWVYVQTCMHLQHFHFSLCLPHYVLVYMYIHTCTIRDCGQIHVPLYSWVAVSSLTEFVWISPYPQHFLSPRPFPLSALPHLCTLTPSWHPAWSNKHERKINHTTAPNSYLHMYLSPYSPLAAHDSVGVREEANAFPTAASTRDSSSALVRVTSPPLGAWSSARDSTSCVEELSSADIPTDSDTRREY